MAKSKEVITTETAYQNFPVDDDGNAIPLGSIEVKDSPAAGGNSRNTFVSPLGPLKQIPLIGEHVHIIQGPSWNGSPSTLTDKGYYFAPFDIQNNINIKILPKTFTKRKSEETLGDEYVASNVPRRATSADAKIGETFTQVDTVKSLQPYEGDTILEGRYGQAIRMSSTILENNHPQARLGRGVYENRGCDDWQGETPGAPITWITNGVTPIGGSARYTTENLDTDAATIVMTAGQKLVSFQTAQPNLGPDVEKSNKADVNQVVINSDRIVFNARQEHIVLAAKRSVTVATPDWAADMNEVLTIMDELLKIMQRITGGSSPYPTTPGIGNGPTLANPEAGAVRALVSRMAALKQ